MRPSDGAAHDACCLGCKLLMCHTHEPSSCDGPLSLRTCAALFSRHARAAHVAIMLCWCARNQHVDVCHLLSHLSRLALLRSRLLCGVVRVYKYMRRIDSLHAHKAQDARRCDKQQIVGVNCKALLERYASNPFKMAQLFKNLEALERCRALGCLILRGRAVCLPAAHVNVNSA